MNKRNASSSTFVSREWDEWIKAALIADAAQRYEEEVRRSKDISDPEFSEDFHKKIREAIPMSERSYVSFRKHAVRRTAVVAASLVLILSFSAVVLAIAVPQIQYQIQKGTVSWEILFHQEYPDESMLENFEFKPIVPTIPEGYEIEEKTEFQGVYQLKLQDGKGGEIEYNQIDAQSVGISLDAEGLLIDERTERDKHYIIQSDGDSTSVLFDNGYYVFLLKGNCDVRILEEMMNEIMSYSG